MNSVRTRVCVNGADIELREIRDGEFILEFRVDVECCDGSRKGDEVMIEPEVDSGR